MRSKTEMHIFFSVDRSVELRQGRLEKVRRKIMCTCLQERVSSEAGGNVMHG